MICWPSCRPMCSARTRAITSLPPPGAWGTISVMGRAGNSSAAPADARPRQRAIATQVTRERAFIAIRSPCFAEDRTSGAGILPALETDCDDHLLPLLDLAAEIGRCIRPIALAGLGLQCA